MKERVYDIIYPGSVPPGVNLIRNVFATMRDGVKIAVDVYRPTEGEGPWPVILAYSSFAKERLFESAKPGFYCLNGYVCVQAAERGIGFNQGQFTFQGPVAARDGYDLVEWIAAQPWCNGNVGMMGASGYGVMQWMTALMNPPHLKTLVALGTTDMYRGLCYPGGVLRKPFVLNLTAGLMLGAVWPGPIAGKQLPSNALAEIFANNQDGPFWFEHGSSWNKIDQIKIAVLNIIQTPNRLHAPAHLGSYADLRSPKKLILTPWTNENYQPWIFETLAFNRHILRWLDYWLKGIETGIMQEPEIAIFDNGAGVWRYENEYPLSRTIWKKYYLHSATPGKETPCVINDLPPAGEQGPDIYHNISLNTAYKDAYGIVANSLPPGRSRKLVYVSEPLETDLRVWGPISLTLYAATTEDITSDWSFFVKLGEMVPQGAPLNPVTGCAENKPEVNDADTPPEVQIWSWGCLKAKYREIDESRSKPGLPWHDFQKPVPITPGRTYEFQIELQPLFKTFRRGSRIWLKIASDDALYSTRDASSQYVETPFSPLHSQISIFHDPEHPSNLLLPVVPDAPEIWPVDSPLRDALPGAARLQT